MILYFSQLILDREALVALHPGYQAAEMKGVELDPLATDSDGAGDRPSDGAAATNDAARAESKMEGSMSLGKKERRVSRKIG
jgi:hypothetical protein